MKLNLALEQLSTAAGNANRLLSNRIGDLSSLSTVSMNNLVEAINEVQFMAQTAMQGGGRIDDSQTTGDLSSTWSSSKILDAVNAAVVGMNAAIATAKAELLGGAAPAFDTLKELADKLTEDGNLVLQIITDLSKRVRVDAVQNFTAAERLQAQENLGLGDVENTDFAAIFNTAAGI